MKAVLRVLLLGLSCAVIGASLPITGGAQPVEIRDGVLFEKNVSIPTDDGAFVMSNVLRPKAEGRYPVLLSIRHADGTITWREENEWPLARTEWKKLYLDAASGALVDGAPAAPARLSYQALGDAALFTTPPLSGEIEVTGPMAAKLYVSSSTEDMDIFHTGGEHLSHLLIPVIP